MTHQESFLSADSASSTIPVTLLSGFLGSGITTVLNHLVDQSELADALVFIMHDVGKEEIEKTFHALAEGAPA